MIRFPCPSCGKTLKAPFGTEGRSSTCKCGAKVVVPQGPPIPMATLLPDPTPETNREASPKTEPVVLGPMDFDVPPSELRRRQRRREQGESPDGDSPNETLGTVSVLLSLAGGGALFLASGSPLLFVNTYLLPSFCLAVAGIVVGNIGKPKAGGHVAGIVIGAFVLLGCFGVYGAASNQWQEIGRIFQR